MRSIPARDLHKELRRGRPRIRVAPAAERTRDGHVFASKAEAEFYGELLLDKHHAESHGEVFAIVLQPKFLLAGVVFTTDFLTVEQRGERFQVNLYEVKGRYQGRFRSEALRRFKRDAAQLKQLHGLEVQLVER